MLLLYSDSEKLQMRDRDKTRKIWDNICVKCFYRFAAQQCE